MDKDGRFTVECYAEYWFEIDPVNYEPCIYKLIHKGVVVYVGQTRHSVMGRIKSHKRDKVFDSVEVLLTRVRDLSIAEAHHIIYFNPKYNKGLPQNELYKTRKKLCRDHEITWREWRKMKILKA